MSLALLIPSDWRAALSAELKEPYFAQLAAFLECEWRRSHICPAKGDVFSALRATPYRLVRVVIVGQDPYHGDGQAHGLSFSVPAGVPPPPSLRNIFRELQDDVGCPAPDNGCLRRWAHQGCLMLNTVLTVRSGEPNSHRGHGWERFTDALIQAVNARKERVVFVLWGNQAQQKAGLLDTSRHAVVQSAHPSPLSARRGFFGSRPFTRINAALAAADRPAIEWAVP